MSEGSTIDNHHRTQSLQNWFQSILGELSPSADSNDFNITLVQGDASFRRYFRAQSGEPLDQHSLLAKKSLRWYQGPPYLHYPAGKHR